MRVFPISLRCLLLLSFQAFLVACAGRLPASPELVRPFNSSIYEVVILIPDGSVEFTNLRARDSISGVWEDTFRAKMQRAGYTVVRDASQDHDLVSKVVLNCVDSTLILQLSDKQQAVDEIRIQEGIWLEACLSIRMADYVSARLVNAYTRSANLSAFADSLELKKRPPDPAKKQVFRTVANLPPSDGRASLSVYPFSGQGDASDEELEAIFRRFTTEIQHAACVRIVGPEILEDAARQLNVKDSCATEACQVELARSAQVDTLVRGSVSRLSGMFIINTTIIDTNTRRILYTDKISSTEKRLEEDAEKLARRIRRFAVCPGK